MLRIVICHLFFLYLSQSKKHFEVKPPLKKIAFIIILTIGVVVNIQLILGMMDRGCERNQSVEIFDTLNIDKSSVLLQKLGKQLQV